MTDPAFPTESAPITLAGPAGALEVSVELPEAEPAPRPLVAIICHPPARMRSNADGHAAPLDPWRPLPARQPLTGP